MHVSLGNCDGKMKDIYTLNYFKILKHISIFRKKKKLNFVWLNILFWPLSADNPRRSGHSASVFVCQPSLHRTTVQIGVDAHSPVQAEACSVDKTGF